MFWPNKAEIGIYFPFHYLPLNNSEVNYLVIMVGREALSQSVSKWKLDGTNRVIMENLSSGGCEQ